MAEYPFDVRFGAFQGHSNQVVDPTVAHHQLTYDEDVVILYLHQLQVVHGTPIQHGTMS